MRFRRPMLVLGTTILFIQSVCMPVGMVYAQTTMDTEEKELMELLPTIEEVGECEVTDGDSKTKLNIQTEESQQITEQDNISSEEKEIKNSEQSTIGNKTDTNQDSKGTRIDESRNGTWGTVSWSWNSSTQTITLQGGTAGAVGSAPWKSHRDVVRIIVEGSIIFPTNSYGLFAELKNLESIDNAGMFDTSNVTSMALMFQNAESLKEIDVASWDTSSVNNMTQMFNGASSIELLDVSNWDTSSVATMFAMFQNTSNLKTVDVSTWDTSNVTNMTQMFLGASSLEMLDVSKWDTSSVTTMFAAFQNTSNLKTLDVSAWDTSNVNNMTQMFNGASSIELLDVSNWDTSSVANMFAAFQNTSNLKTLDVSNWDTSNVRNMTQMFNGASSLEKLDVSNWDTSSVTNMFAAFQNTSNLKTLDVSNWDTSNVSNMQSMFNGASSIELLDVSKWDTSSVTNMVATFQNTSNLKTLDVSAWDTSSVNNMRQMFLGASSIEMLDVSKWDTSNVNTINDMFTGVTNLSTLHLGTRSRFDHLSNPPAMPIINSSNNSTGNWVYYLSQSNTIPETYITYSPTNFWREYDGTNPGTYQWQTTGSVAVHYRDINDQSVKPPERLTGGIRAPFQIEEKEIDGYTLKEVPNNTSGRFTEEEQVIVFRYMKDIVDPVDPLNPEIDVDPENPPELPENQGTLSIDFLSSFTFGSQAISAQTKRYYAQPQRLLNLDGTLNDAEERPNYIQVSDRRPDNERKGWTLAVTQNNQFTDRQGN
ncbi:BspA family leucine-rich repeat surface protein, partial [Enterococcus casseliflavus]|uniref:BspA family leucine-rich repeat surface protein n=6 Tax=Enterococcus casseliflavus TaxID=37734 RepID=UPI002DB83061